MSPWWLRPTSEGAANEENPERPETEPKQEQREPAPSLPTDRDADASGRRQDGIAGTAGAFAAPVAPLAPAAPPANAAGGRESAREAEPVSPTTPEPYRAFWQPRETVSIQETPASVPTAAPAARAASWRSTAISDLDRDREEDAAARPPQPVDSAREPAAQVAASDADALAADTADTADTADAEGEGEGEAEDRDEESRPEVKKKRSRRSRGGRRKNGRAAAAGGGAEPAEDDDDDLDAEETPAPFPVAPAPPVAASPQPLAHRAARGGESSARAGESYVISASDLDSMSREIIISVPDRQRQQQEERKIAVFCDFENIALGVRDSEISKLDIGLILERLLEKGRIIVKKAYADWERYSDYKRPFHEAAIELIDIPQKFYSGKNSADIKMVVDAMDISYAKEHLDTFVILSGDSDFSPLVSKLKENNKYVIGIGVKNSSSNLLVDNCDEFIYYEDIWRDAQKGPKLDGLSKKTAEAFSLMVESIQALVRENKDVLWGSMIKQTMQRKKPSFNEGYYGYSTFSELLEDAERKAIVKLKKDQRSGTYIVTGFAKSGDAGPGRRQA